MVLKKISVGITIAATCLSVAGCQKPWDKAKGSAPTPTPVTETKNSASGIGDLTGYSYLNNLQVTENLPVKLYLDGTASMAGYTNKNAPSVFKDIIKSIEPIFNARWKSNKIEYVRFGDAYVPFNGENFLDFEKESFYVDRDTRLDNVIKDTDNAKLSIIVTDLFQTNQNYTSLCNALASKCFGDQTDRSLAIIGVKSQFKGKIFDVANHAPVEYSSVDNKPNTYRPVYLLVVGKDADVKVFAYELQRKFNDVKVSLFTNEYTCNNDLGLGKDFGKTKNGFQNKGNKEGKSADGIIHVKAKAGNSFSDSLVFFAKRLPVMIPEKYDLRVVKMEKMTGGSWNPLSKNKAAFQEVDVKNIIKGAMSISFKGADIESLAKFDVDARKENVGKYRITLGIYPSREDYVDSQNVFGDWNFDENKVPAKDAEIGIKTQSVSEFTKLVADKHYMQDKPGIGTIQLYLDID